VAERRDLLRGALSWGLTLAITAMVIRVHSVWLAVDEQLPWGDAPGHLRILVRWDHWIGLGWKVPIDPFPPALYLVSDFFHRQVGAGLDTALFGVVVFAGVLAAGLSRVGWRLQGLTACVLLPLVVLAAPTIGNYARLYLLGLPAAALLPWVFLCCWASDGYRRWLPTLGVGLTLGLAILSKYQIAYWLLPILVAPGLLMVARSPAALVPLIGVAPVFALVLKRLLDQAVVDPAATGELLDATIRYQGLLIAEAAGVLVVLWAAIRWKASGRWRTRLQPGFALALAALLTLAMVVPWSMVVADALHTHVQYVTQEMERAPWPIHEAMLWGQIDGFWPLARTWLWLGLGLAGLELLLRWTPIERTPLPRWLYGAEDRLPLGVPLAIVATSGGLGVTLTVTQVLADPRYYLPLFVILGFLVALPLCRLRPTRWVLAPVLGAACLLQLHPGWGRTLDALSGRFVSVGVHSAYTSGRYDALVPPDGKWLLHYAADPVASGAAGATERALIAARTIGRVPRTLGGSTECGGIAYITGVPVEDRTMYGLAALHGHGECTVDRLARVEQRTGQLMWEPKTRSPKALLMVATTPDQDATVLTALSERSELGWEVLSSEPVLGDRAVTLYRWARPEVADD